MRVLVQAANVQDRAGGRSVLELLPKNRRLKLVRVDQGYRSEPLATWCLKTLKATLSVSERDPQRKGFVVQQGRWVIERTFAWLGRYRRLSKDYEQSLLVSESLIYIASIRLLLRRLSR